MAFDLPVTRRTFLKLAGSGAVAAISIRSLPAHAYGMCTGQYTTAPNSDSPKNAAFIQRPNVCPIDERPDWARTPGKADYRIDGWPKVLGAKIYARDFKARDFGWHPEHWLYAVRCNRIDAIFDGLHLGMLDSTCDPLVIIDYDMIAGKRVNTSCYQNYGYQDPPLLAQIGHNPDFYGQPAALLIFSDFDRYRKAKRILDFNPDVVRYGAAHALADLSHLDTMGSYVYARTTEPPFDYVHNGKTYSAQSKQVLSGIKAAVAANPAWLRFGTDQGTLFETPAIDPAFLEPESGLAYYDSDKQALQLVLGTQSPNDDATYALHLFDNSDVKLKTVDVIACFPGGGFGGRDRSYFPVYLALAAPFAAGALRWQSSRYEQFQMGLKRSQSAFNEALWISPDGNIEALICDFELNGGRKDNLQSAIAKLAAVSAANCYEIPRAYSSGTARLSHHPFGGSQRGFGTPQAFMAIETLIDEAAQHLHMDPIAIRRRNLLSIKHNRKAADGTSTGDETIAGAPILFDLQLEEILDKLEQHPLWQTRQRSGRKAGASRYGVGLALSNHAYGGSSQDGMFGMVEILPDLSLRVHTTYVDMGNGAATALGLAPSEYLGTNAHAISMGQIDVFNQFGLNPGSGNTSDLYVPALYGSASSCLSAFHQFHAVQQAALVLFRQSIVPIAAKRWKVSNKDAASAHWNDGRLELTGHRPLDRTQLFRDLVHDKANTVAAVHATYAGTFWQAGFLLGGEKYETMDVDFVALGNDPYKMQPVKRLAPPKRSGPNTSSYIRVTFAPAGAIVAVSVDVATGRVKVEQVVTVLSSGKQHCPPIVLGQSNGAIAMAMSNVLSETCPDGDDGPGNGRWNFDRYPITRMRDMPETTLICLDAPGNGKDARGIAEAVMCPIGAALLNAIAMATGRRFRITPVTPDDIRKAFV